MRSSVAVAALLIGLASPQLAAAQDLASIGRQVTELEAQARKLAKVRLRATNQRSPTFVEERLTDGELFYNLQDYVRASIIFTDIVDNFPRHRAYPDALFLLADSLFRAGDHLGARTRFRQIIERSDEQQFRPFLQRALGRLIEIAIHTRDFEGIEQYFERLSRIPPTEIEAATAYFRAKYLYNRAVPTDEIMREPAAGAAAPQVDVAQLEQARVAFEAVPEGSPYWMQARYFIGVIYTLREQYPQGIEAFRRVLRGRATTDEHRQVVDLTHIALGRLYYETDQLDQAIEAYQAVPRTSSFFDVALYEIGWVFIRQGDSTRAERALEVLTIAAPDSRFIPDAKILRGNLLLRNGRFADADRVFREIRSQFGPVRRELEDMIASHDDPRAYFQQLVRDNIESFDANSFLPPLAIQWTRLEGDMDRALRVLGDLNQCRTLLRETTDLVDRLNAALNAVNRVNIFPDTRSHRQQTISMRNRAARIRQALLRVEGGDGGGGGELGQVRARRREIERFLGRMPTGGEDFDLRNDRLLIRYRDMARELRDLEVELMGMDARIVAMERFLDDTQNQHRDPAGVQSIRAELQQHREAVQQYRAAIVEINRAIEIGRLQVGVGDDRYQRDQALRDEYNQLVARELQLNPSRNPQVDGLFGRLAAVEAVLDSHDLHIDAVVQERTAEMRRQVDEESARLVGYRTQLGDLETEAIEVVGAVTYANFNDVRQRFYDLVLRADVGRIDVAWAEREEHRMRVDLLTRERSREIQSLDDEFREIMDEGATDEEEGAESRGATGASSSVTPESGGAEGEGGGAPSTETPQ